MSKKREDVFAPVRNFLPQLSRLTHDELRDLRDMLIADAAENVRGYPHRHGLPPVFPDDGHALILHGGWKYRDEPPLYTRAARQELHEAYEAAGELSPEAQALIVDIVAFGQRALAPVEKRKRTADGTPLAKGTIHAKIIRRKIVDPDTGEVEIKPFGPYLYYRSWVTGGDADKRGKRLKDKYIGLPGLAQRFDATAPGSDERRELEARIIEAHQAGTLQALMIDMGLQRVIPPAGELPHIDELGNSAAEVDAHTPAVNSPSPVFLANYVPASARKKRPQFFALTEIRREVLAVYAAGMNYAADNVQGIERRKIARQLVEAGLLAEVTGYTDHRKHNWRLTEAGLYLIRGDDDLQQRISQKLPRDN
jgi:hypothetical protein